MTKEETTEANLEELLETCGRNYPPREHWDALIDSLDSWSSEEQLDMLRRCHIIFYTKEELRDWFLENTDFGEQLSGLSEDEQIYKICERFEIKQLDWDLFVQID